jgi:hypothetical protein
MPKATAILSQFHNIPAGDLADRLGAVKAEIADLETREKALRDELIRRNVPAIEGDAYSATITDAVRWTLDTKAIKTEMGASWYDARCRQSLVTTVKTAARAAVAVQIAA